MNHRQNIILIAYDLFSQIFVLLVLIVSLVTLSLILNAMLNI